MDFNPQIAQPKSSSLKVPRWHYFLLLAILLFGFGVRCYNINFPSLGYHDMKENEYLSIAEEMNRSGDYITRRIYFYDAFENDPSMKLYPQLPLVSYQTLISWKLLGENLWGPRLFNILFGVLSILIVYLIALLLFTNGMVALWCASIMAILPLSVFFSRNIQPESPALFFMLLGNYFYLRYAERIKNRDLLFGGIAFSIAWLYKFSFIFGIAPFLFVFPIKRIFHGKKAIITRAITLILSYSLVFITVLWLKNIGEWQFRSEDTLVRINLLEVFSPSYWKQYGHSIWWYVKGENFTPVYTFATAFGFLLAIAKPRGVLNRYLIGWGVTIIPYAMIFSDFINQHNYYQMPFLGFVCISSAYAVWSISGIIKFWAEHRVKIFVILAITLISISIPFSYRSLYRMHRTVFLGLDVAGESLKQFTKPGERIFLLTHSQGMGIGRYARRHVGWVEGLDDFKEKEKKFGVRYVCFYPAEFAPKMAVNDPELYKYIESNYHLKELGLVEDPRKFHYIILEKGKGSDPETFLKSFSGTKELRTIYRVVGNYVFFYALRPKEE